MGMMKAKRSQLNFEIGTWIDIDIEREISSMVTMDLITPGSLV